MDYCKKCKREFDPSTEFVEEVELLDCLDRYVNVDYYCPDCLEELDKKFVFTVLNWDPNT